jgi:hypothetical protein
MYCCNQFTHLAKLLLLCIPAEQYALAAVTTAVAYL